MYRVPIMTASGDAPAVDGAGDAKIHDPRVPVPVDHDVLGLEVAVQDPQVVGLGQPLTNLAGDAHGLGFGQVAGAADEAFQIFARHEFHGDVKGRPLLTQVVHPADVSMRNLARFTSLLKRSG
jgi:hypothetical protein